MTSLLSPLAELPNLLASEAEKFIEQFGDRNPDDFDWLKHCLSDAEFSLQLSRVWSCSRFVADLCCRKPEIFREVVSSGRLQRSHADGEMARLLDDVLKSPADEEGLNRGLRLFRQREMLRIVWRDINRFADLVETTADVTALAECCLQRALDFHHLALSEVHGKPMARLGGGEVEQRLVVLGMGKLGAWELNLSSDIDLIFSYPYGGQTTGPRAVDNQEFFTRVARKLIQSLDNVTVDSFVFRVDMRLRPYGESGALVLSFGAMEEYYQTQGRDWERYAMIKARVVAGDLQSGAELMGTLRPFVYRRYIDFSAIESLRDMKRMIRREVKRRRLSDDVKLGAGGIREVEFIAQCFQLIRGGREPEFQERRVLKVLQLIGREALMPPQAVEDLCGAYIFLRNTEHAIQAYRDQQTQKLPDSEYPRAAVAAAMGFSSWDAFSARLAEHRDKVDQHFREVVAEEEAQEQNTAVDKRWQGLWSGDCDADRARALLSEAGHEDPAEVLRQMVRLREDNHVRRMQTVGRERLDQFMPLLLGAVINAGQPSATLLRVLPLVESVLRRTAYLVLLVENPLALARLVLLCSGSPWIARELARNPVLLDELLDDRTLYHVPDKADLRDEIQQQMKRLNQDDLEGHMEGLRYFKLAHQLHVTAAEVTGRLPLMKVSDYLTIIAEVVLEYVLELAWRDLTARYGCPQKAGGVACDRDFIIVGYGKLGGIELGPGSDLDLVFIHDTPSGLATDGERAIDNTTFFTRLGQRIIHILTAHTASGMLYEVDMRLRPSGASGLLVSSLAAFEKYQQREAWTWEHQALVRARVVAGDPGLAERFEQLRCDLLCRPRDPEAVRRDVREMRAKMRDHLMPRGLESRDPPIFHLKQSAGAIVDIEFMVQYAVLIWAPQHPSLAVFSDNIRILEALGREGLFSPSESEALIDAYKVFRAALHRLTLLEQPGELSLSGDEGKKLEAHRRAVIAKWQQLLD